MPIHTRAFLCAQCQTWNAQNRQFCRVCNARLLVIHKRPLSERVTDERRWVRLAKIRARTARIATKLRCVARMCFVRTIVSIAILVFLIVSYIVGSFLGVFIDIAVTFLKPHAWFAGPLVMGALMVTVIWTARFASSERVPHRYAYLGIAGLMCVLLVTWPFPSIRDQPPLRPSQRTLTQADRIRRAADCRRAHERERLALLSVGDALARSNQGWFGWFDRSEVSRARDLWGQTMESRARICDYR